MGRTLNRPLPSGRISPPHALAFGLSTGAVGSAMLASQVNPLAGSLALSNILLYTCAYTPMKVVHPVNTWIGAVVGGLPPLIGDAFQLAIPPFHGSRTLQQKGLSCGWL